MKTKKGIVLGICCCFLLSGLFGCGAESETMNTQLGNGWQADHSLALQYAKNFNVDYYDGGYALISISDGSRYLVVPEGQAIPENMDSEIVVLQQPLHNIYLVATSAMCLFDAIDALDSITLSGAKAEDWYVENARAAMESGKMVYAGKYNKPDYELILAQNCTLAIESNMINHTPDVKEKLQTLGISVLTEQSSYEKHPLGRTEWIKLYGVLMGKEEQAEKLFEEQKAYLDSVEGLESTGKTVAFFYINSAGSAVARKSGDYVTKMIQLAGGKYVFDALGDPEKVNSTVTLEMEEFYATAKNADFIIYNSTIDGGVETLADLIAKNQLLADFKAIQNGNVWCTSENLFQETTQLGLMISDIHKMLVSDEELTQLNFMSKLK